MTVVWGAACTTVVGLILLTYVYPWATHTDSQFIYLNQKIVLGTAIPAFLGAVVSILSRLQDFRDDQGVDPKILFMTAFFKPYIGMISGLFIISALGVGIGSVLKDIDLIPTASTDSQIVWPTAKNFYFLYVVGFLAGFSERLTKDFIGAAEDRISPRNRTQT